MSKAEICCISNQKGGVGKTTTAENLGIGLAEQGKRVLLIDMDPQGSLTVALGNQRPDDLDITVTDVMRKMIEGEDIPEGYGILHHPEGIDLLPANIELAGMEAALVNVMSRETILKDYLATVRKNYDNILIDCMPSLGMLTVRIISVNHALVYYKTKDDESSAFRVSEPKTSAGIRTIPMMDMVYDAFQMLYEEQKENGFNDKVIDGMSGFVFCNRFGNVPNPQTVNRTIKRIVANYNNEELLEAAKKRREPLLLPEFSCHQLRHTFCTRLCENETNLKVIQSVMGHRDIATTMDIYAEATDRKKQESFEKLSQLDIF